MKQIKVGPVPGYKDTYLVKKVQENKPLQWHTSYGSLYIYDAFGNSVTIERHNSNVGISAMYNDGEELLLEECDYDYFNHVLCPFTYEELRPFIDNYTRYVGTRY